MEQWEHATVLFPYPIIADRQWEELPSFLNEWGEQGWQLVEVVTRRDLLGREDVSYVVIFKRRKLQGNTMPPES
jgi:hypothetical protein